MKSRRSINACLTTALVIVQMLLFACLQPPCAAEPGQGQITSRSHSHHSQLSSLLGCSTRGALHVRALRLRKFSSSNDAITFLKQLTAEQRQNISFASQPARDP